MKETMKPSSKHSLLVFDFFKIAKGSFQVLLWQVETQQIIVVFCSFLKQHLLLEYCQRILC